MSPHPTTRLCAVRTHPDAAPHARALALPGHALSSRLRLASLRPSGRLTSGVGSYRPALQHRPTPARASQRVRASRSARFRAVARSGKRKAESGGGGASKTEHSQAEPGNEGNEGNAPFWPLRASSARRSRALRKCSSQAASSTAVVDAPPQPHPPPPVVPALMSRHCRALRGAEGGRRSLPKPRSS